MPTALEKYVFFHSITIISMKKTKILATIGPASMSSSIIRRMHSKGMDAFRVNTAYGDIKWYQELIEKVWSIADIPAVLDLKGPEVRIKSPQHVLAKKGDLIRIGFRPEDNISFNRNILSQLTEGEKIVLDKGKAMAIVASVSRRHVTLKMLTDCEFRNGLGVNMPGKKLSIPTLSAHDKKAIKLAKEMGIDYVALSFTRGVSDVKTLKRSLKGTDIGIISKIENRQGIDGLTDIILESEGVMVARGDLGIEIPYQDIPLVQKDIINRCNRLGKISIVATEMLHSMVKNPLPSRAETSDVANAIIDGADCVMLSAESAAGKYPVESVKAMSDIAYAVEKQHPPKTLDEEVHDNVSMAISKAVISIIDTVDVDKIVVATHSGYTAMLISNFRSCKDIIAVTANDKIRRKLNMVYAVNPILHPEIKGDDKILDIAKYCLDKGLVAKKDLVLFTAGVYTQRPVTNLVELHRMDEFIRYGKSAKKKRPRCRT